MPKESFINKLIQRRIPQILGSYLVAATSLVLFIEYLVEKYQTIEDLFDLTETIRVNDFIAISQALEQKSDWEELLKLGKLAQKQYPGTTMGYYFTALSQEGLGEPKKALRTYQSAFPMNELGGISEDFLMMKAEAIKRDFGYN
mgnify:CR=1 FL=1